MKCNLSFLLLSWYLTRYHGVIAQSYTQPAWWPLIESTFDGVNLSKCDKRNHVPPSDGQRCSQRKPKTCFFGDQYCGGDAYPDLKCFCIYGAWRCTPVLCPTAPPAPGLPTEPPASPPYTGPCSNVLIDFETRGDGSHLAAGDYVKDEWSIQYGITVSATSTTGFTPLNMPRIFDTSSPGTNDAGDPDLGSPNQLCIPSGPGVGTGGVPNAAGENCAPQGLVLIIQESDTVFPDDNVEGGMIVFDFAVPTDVNSLGLMDIEPGATVTSVSVTKATNQVETFNAQGLGDNSVENIPLSVSDAKQVKITFGTSGAVTHLNLCIYSGPPTGPPIYVPPTDPPVYVPPTDPPVYVPPTDPPVYVPPTDPPVYVPPTDPPVYVPPTDLPVYVPPTDPPTDAPVYVPPTDPPAYVPPTDAPVYVPPTDPPVYVPPTDLPVYAPPTKPPTTRPTRPPTKRPTRAPTPLPTRSPTPEPTRIPTRKPTPRPSRQPTPQPSRQPTPRPSIHPTPRPTRAPTKLPTRPPTPLPTKNPTPRPTTNPTPFPSRQPTPQPSRRPTPRPSVQPTPRPTRAPTKLPTRAPTPLPTKNPTPRPTTNPTPFPSRPPTPQPSRRPTPRPSVQPTPRPTRAPTPTPTKLPTRAPTPLPTKKPTPRPTTNPTPFPSRRPTPQPSRRPTPRPSKRPTKFPTSSPVYVPPTDPPVYVPPTDAPIYIPPTNAPVYVPPTDAPVYVTPTDAPVYVPPTDTPVYVPPTDAPVYVAPTNAPVYVAPTDSPVYVAPTDAPVYVPPTDAPVYVAPTDAPVYVAPTDAPVYVAPTDAPVYVAPTDPPYYVPPPTDPPHYVPTDPPNYVPPTDPPYYVPTPIIPPSSPTPDAFPTSNPPTITTCSYRRQDINNDFTLTEQQELATLVEQYVDTVVIGQHTAPGLHHTAAFLPWHRTYIGGLESFLSSPAINKPNYVPLPKWNPQNPIPSPFFVIDNSCGPCGSLPTPPVGLPVMPTQLDGSNVCSYADVDELRLGGGAAFPSLENWHDWIHVGVGGAFGSVPTATHLLIFLLWHAFVDDIYWCYCQCGDCSSIAPPPLAEAAEPNFENDAELCLEEAQRMVQQEVPTFGIDNTALMTTADEALVTFADRGDDPVVRRRLQAAVREQKNFFVNATLVVLDDLSVQSSRIVEQVPFAAFLAESIDQRIGVCKALVEKVESTTGPDNVPSTAPSDSKLPSANPTNLKENGESTENEDFTTVSPNRFSGPSNLKGNRP